MPLFPGSIILVQFCRELGPNKMDLDLGRFSLFVLLRRKQGLCPYLRKERPVTHAPQWRHFEHFAKFLLDQRNAQY